MLSLRVTEGVANLLEETASCSGLPNAVREDARKLIGAENIVWDNLKSIADSFRKANPDKPVYLHKLCSQSDVLLPAPPTKEKSPELLARLARLQDEVDNKRYAEMVSDVTEQERKADDMKGSILPTMRLQLSFGAHVLVTMFTFWAVSYYGTKMWFGFDDLWAGLAGALGLTAGLLLETVLLIIRTNRFTTIEERMPELFDKVKVKEAYDKVKELKKQEAEEKKKKKRAGKDAGGGGPPAAVAAIDESTSAKESKKSK